MEKIESLEKLLQQGPDSPLLRFSLGSEYFNTGGLEQAVEHLAKAVAQDPGYSAAWKLYGKALAETGRLYEAIGAFDSGIVAARQKGDIQAAKEMEVFRKRAQKSLPQNG